MTWEGTVTLEEPLGLLRVDMSLHKSSAILYLLTNLMFRGKARRKRLSSCYKGKHIHRNESERGQQYPSLKCLQIGKTCVPQSLSFFLEWHSFKFWLASTHSHRFKLSHLATVKLTHSFLLASSFLIVIKHSFFPSKGNPRQSCLTSLKLPCFI